MSSKNETVVDVKSEMYGIVADEFGYVRLAQSDFVGLADRLEAAHDREIAAKDAEIEILNKRLERVVDDRNMTCGLCEPSKKILELSECLKDACNTELSCSECKSPCSEYTQDDCPIKKRWRKALEGMKDVK